MNEKDGPSTWIKSSGGDGKRTRLYPELEAFWLRHPDSKFAKSTLCYALDCGKLEMDKALRFMIGSDLIEVHVRYGTPFYWVKKRHNRTAGGQRN